MQDVARQAVREYDLIMSVTTGEADDVVAIADRIRSATVAR